MGRGRPARARGRAGAPRGALRAGGWRVPQEVLTQTLRRLQDSGLVERHEYAAFPRRLDYDLTELGRTLEEPIAMLTRWARTFGADVVASQEASAAAPPTSGDR